MRSPILIFDKWTYNSLCNIQRSINDFELPDVQTDYREKQGPGFLSRSVFAVHLSECTGRLTLSTWRCSQLVTLCLKITLLFQLFQ